ncbi:MAG: hypothetical protein IPP29_19345 [Bacteroidetes bacterium]|nr:hypothetical protein [Bacteroidota bacterium]
MRTREITWLGVFIIGLMMGLYKSMIAEWQDGLWFYIFAGVGLIFFFLRRRQRLYREMHDYYNQDVKHEE